MAEAQNLGINLDKKSVEILKKVDSTFRDTIVNIGLRMVENTELFLTLTGERKDTDINDMVSLDKISDEEDKPSKVKKGKAVAVEAAPVKKPAQSWDSF